MALLPGSAAPLLAAAAFLMGLGYGPITPASSEVLVRTTPTDRMALTFSIKQTGVPAGAALAGASLPGLALLAGWRGAFVAIAAVGLVVVAAPSRRAGRSTAHDPAARPFSLARSFGAAAARPAHRRRCASLSLAGFAFAAVQVCLTSFLVVYLDGRARLVAGRVRG